MKIVCASFADLSDNEVLAASVRLAGAERHATAELVVVLMEMDARRLYLGDGFSSLFTYCTGALHLSEHLAEGSLTLATICLLSPHLTHENHAELLATAKHKSKREVERPSRPATSNSRHIPAAVKREVWARDAGRCAFIGTRGRCAERGFLELHHVVPFADGGASDATNLQLRCRAHNAYEAEQWFGPSIVRELSPEYASSPRREFGSPST